MKAYKYVRKKSICRGRHAECPLYALERARDTELKPLIRVILAWLEEESDEAIHDAVMQSCPVHALFGYTIRLRGRTVKRPTLVRYNTVQIHTE